MNRAPAPTAHGLRFKLSTCHVAEQHLLLSDKQIPRRICDIFSWGLVCSAVPCTVLLYCTMLYCTTVLYCTVLYSPGAVGSCRGWAWGWGRGSPGWGTPLWWGQPAHVTQILSVDNVYMSVQTVVCFKSSKSSSKTAQSLKNSLTEKIVSESTKSHSQGFFNRKARLYSWATWCARALIMV